MTVKWALLMGLIGSVDDVSFKSASYADQSRLLTRIDIINMTTW
ncbi:hypothetical protein [Aquirhabdus parva]|nr:hypothetical protein [Aquirhabdus parva]